MKRKPTWILAAACLLMTASAQPQTERSGSSGNAQLMRQMQQLASERTQLQAENARLKQELDAARKERDGLKTASAGLESRARALQAAATRAGGEREASAQELAQQRARMEELIAKFRETAGLLKEVESQRATAAQALATRDVELAQCTDRNQKLFALNDEVLTRLGNRGFWSGLASAEPFTQLKRTQNENLIGEYRARAEDQKVENSRL